MDMLNIGRLIIIFSTSTFLSSISSKLKTRELRTRHGDIVNISNYETDIELKGAKRTEKYHIPAGSTVFFTNGMKIKKGFKLAQFEPAAQGSGSRLTEKATKDITADMSGEVLYEDFDTTGGKGSVIYQSNANSKIYLEDVVIKNNASYGNGGAIYAAKGFTINAVNGDVLFKGNYQNVTNTPRDIHIL